MRISIDTETEEIQELRHAIAILEDAVKRREDPDFYDESAKEDKFDDFEKQEPSPVNIPEPIKAPEIHVEAPKPIEIPKSQEIKLPPPVQQPIKRQVAPPPPVDISALTMSDRGKNNSASKPASSSSQYALRTPPPSSFNSSQNMSPRVDNKSIVKDIVRDLVNQSSGKPIAMQDILSRARNRNISESETRNLVSTLQRENLI